MSIRMRTRPRAQAIEQNVWRAIRARRKALKMTQLKVAKACGWTPQQQHKYETGMNRISAGHLLLLADALELEVGYFFEGARPLPKRMAKRAKAEAELMRAARGMTLRELEGLAFLATSMATSDEGEAAA